MDGITISAPTLTWAQQRSGRAEDSLGEKFPKWHEWLNEESAPTFAELEKLSKFTRIPLGYFFLDKPPLEELPIPDFRVGRGKGVTASADLVETIYASQRRQAWYEDYLRDYQADEPLPFVGSAQRLSPREAAEKITDALDFSVESRQKLRVGNGVRTYLVSKFEELGGLVVVNSMVDNSSTRMLDLEEFRGFTLHSATAPLVFINANDTKNGQVFSLLHEFAHVWRGESGVSQGGDPLGEHNTAHERWCDEVASHIAVPDKDLRKEFNPKEDLTHQLDCLSQRYKCSTLVILIKLRDTGLLDAEGFQSAYEEEKERLINLIKAGKKGTGGDFYNNQPFRVGRTLSRAVIRDTNAGRTSMTEALRLLAFSKISVFDKYAERLGEY